MVYVGGSSSQSQVLESIASLDPKTKLFIYLAANFGNDMIPSKENAREGSDKKEMIFGTRAVIEAIKAGREIERIYIQSGSTNDLIRELIQAAQLHHAPYSFIPQEKLNRLSSKNHQGVICLLAAVQYASLESIIDFCYNQGRQPFFLIIDRVTDVRNFGAIARTAECAGLDAIIIGDKGNAPITGDAMKTSAGALSRLPVCRERDMKKTFQLLKNNGIQIVA